MKRLLRRRLALAGVLLAPLAVVAWVRYAPLPTDLLRPLDDVSTTVVDRRGVALYEARSRTGDRMTRLDAGRLPPTLVAATVAAEDRRFRSHLGVDPRAVARAVVRNVRAGHVVEGGSTITQQVAKLLLDRRASGRRPRGVRAKLEESVIALRLEARLSKDAILAAYLNLAPYGNQIAGAGRASEMYFGVRPDQLTIAQAAFIAGLPQRPSAFNPYRQRRRATLRQRLIIGAMLRDRSIGAEDATIARQETLRLTPWRPAFVAPHFVAMVLGSAGGARERIETTLDADLQQDVSGIVAAHRADLAKHGAHNVAVVVLDNATAQWLAWEGSGDYGDVEHGGTIDGVLSPRQPGSALKPFVYGLAFELGDTPATIVPDVASSYPTAQPGIVYTPRNYDGGFHGPLRVRQALAGSQNVPAVDVASRVGVPELLRMLRSVGFSGFDRTASYYGLGVALGNAEVTLADMVSAYAAVARGGLWMAPTAVRRPGPAPTPRRVLSARSAYWLTDILSDDDARAYVFGRGGSLEFPFPVAVKTGTSQAYRDNWTIGYTREVTVGVWVGNFDRQPLIGSSGVTGAGPIFHAVMLAAQQHVGGQQDVGAPIVERPDDLVEHTVCALSGMEAGAQCPLRRKEWLPANASPLPCSWHHPSDEGLLTVWPDRYREWAVAHGVSDDRPAVVAAVNRFGLTPGRSTAAPARRLAISSPPEGATYLIDPTLRPEFQTLALRATGASRAVTWSIDGAPVGRSAADRPLHWPLARGSHRVVARDADGATDEVAITVK